MKTALPSALALAAVLAGNGCASAHGIAPFTWDDASRVLALDDGKVDADGAAAIVLLREQKLAFRVSGAETHSDVFTHEVLKLVTEAGFDRARVQLYWPKDGHLVHLDARTIAPDGTVTPLDTQELFSTEVKLGEDRGADVRIFQFPRVEVGSVVELAYHWELDGLYTSWWDRISEDLPIRDLKVDVAVDSIAQPAMRVVNSDVTPVVTKGDDGLKHISFEMWNVPAAVDEVYAPPWRAREPWWIYRTISYRWSTVWYANGDWEDASSSLQPMLQKGKGLEGAPAIDASSCKGDAGCVIKLAVEKTRELTRFTGFNRGFQHRKLSEILASRTASAGDKAVLLYAILKKAGIDARLAGIARVGAAPVPKDFPSLLWFDHTLVVAVMGDQAAWLDPSCEYCRSGFLPSWDPIGGAALVVTAGPDRKPHTQWWKVNGPLETQPENLEERNYAVDLADARHPRVVLDETLRGEPAVDRAIDTRNDDDNDVRRDAVRLMRSYAAAARVSVARQSCDRAAGTCTRHVEATLPGYATSDANGNVSVPLDVLALGLELRPEDRKTDVVIRTPERIRARVEVTAPAGLHVVTTPKPRSAGGALASACVTEEGGGNHAVVTREILLRAGRVRRADVAGLAHIFDTAAGSASSVVALGR